MAIRTPEQLKQLFQQSKEQKEQQRQQQRLEKQQQYQQLCKEADRLLKEDQERLKKEKMEQLSTLNPKTPQKPLKRFYINLLNNRWIDENGRVGDFSRDELEKLCPHCINWDVWDKVVEQTRQQLGVTPKEIKHKKKRTKLWAYDATGKLINEYFDCSIAAREFGLTLGTIHEYSRYQKKIKGITISNKPLEL